jgi:glycine/D-amino acid oxidase-like deaminating enzyme
MRDQGLSVDRLDESDVNVLEPSIRSSFGGALYHDAIWVNPVSLLAVLTNAFLRLGGRLLEGSKVDGLVIDQSVCRGIRVGGSVVVADAIVICAGSNSDHFLGSGGGITMRGQCLLVRGVTPRQPLYIGELDIVPVGRETALIGATQELGVSNRVRTLSGVRDLILSFEAHTAWSTDVEILEHRVGVRSCELNGMPLLARVPHIADLYCLTSLWKNGIGLAPMFARALISMMTASKTESDFPEFGWQREIPRDA